MPERRRIVVKTRGIVLGDFLNLAADRSYISAGATYLVGGAVRDALMGLPSDDMDAVVEGKKRAEDFAGYISEKLNVSYTAHRRFGTYVFKIPDRKNGHKMYGIDIATARSEVYPSPASLPSVKFDATIRDDLFRRDFTINAMAVSFADIGKMADHFSYNGIGKVGRNGCGMYFFYKENIIDPFGGMEDLAKKQIRVIQRKSFIDDPTRIIRAARFASRFGFEVEKNTFDLIRSPEVKNAISRLTPQRIGNEIALIASERYPAAAIAILIEMDIAKDFFPDINLSKLKVWLESENRKNRCNPGDAVFLAEFIRAAAVEPMVFLNRYSLSRKLKKEVVDNLNNKVNDVI